MDKILEYINQKTDDKYISYIFEKCVFDKKNSTIQLFFNRPKNTENTENNTELEVLCKKYFEKLKLNIEVVVNDFTINFSDLKNVCFEVAKNVIENQTISQNSIDIQFHDKSTNVLIMCEKCINSNLVEHYKMEIEKQVFEKLNYRIQVNFLFQQIDKISAINDRKNKIREDNLILESQQHSQLVELKNIKNIYGEVHDEMALLAGNFDGNQNLSVVGTMQNFAVKESKSKNTEDSEEKNVCTRKYLSFVLSYNDKDVRCSMFLSKGEEPISLENGKTYVVCGTLNNFNDMVSIRAKGIAECEIITPKMVWRKCPNNYTYVKPEKFVQQEQVGLFFVEEMTKNQYLLNNTFVVYDLETTGINLLHDKIIDIGAYKIVNGKIVDKFSTFVNPEIPIPAEASKVNRITDDMVASYPNIDKILPDFYKFCYGSIIVGYNNIGFDDAFINREGRRLKYNFDNQRNDAIVLARANLPGLKNYKLSTVCANQNVPLIDAHRAINDALATAKLFIKLAEKFC